MFRFYFWHPMLVRPAMKRLFCLKAKNGLGRFAPSALPHYQKMYVVDQKKQYILVRTGTWYRQSQQWHNTAVQHSLLCCTRTNEESREKIWYQLGLNPSAPFLYVIFKTTHHVVLAFLCLASYQVPGTFFYTWYFELFLFFLFLFSPASQYLHALRVPSSVQQPSATLSKYLFYSTCSFCLTMCHLYPTSSRIILFLFV